MKDYDINGDHLQVIAVDKKALEESLLGPRPEPVARDPAVPFHYMPWRNYRAREPFDVVRLARSPEYTPAEADPIFDEIRERFIDETVLA